MAGSSNVVRHVYGLDDNLDAIPSTSRGLARAHCRKDTSLYVGALSAAHGFRKYVAKIPRVMESRPPVCPY